MTTCPVHCPSGTSSNFLIESIGTGGQSFKDIDKLVRDDSRAEPSVFTDVIRKMVELDEMAFTASDITYESVDGLINLVSTITALKQLSTRRPNDYDPESEGKETPQLNYIFETASHLTEVAQIVVGTEDNKLCAAEMQYTQRIVDSKDNFRTRLYTVDHLEAAAQTENVHGGLSRLQESWDALESLTEKITQEGNIFSQVQSLVHHASNDKSSTFTKIAEEFEKLDEMATIAEEIPDAATKVLLDLAFAIRALKQVEEDKGMFSTASLTDDSDTNA